jgi:hypothetical protein
MEKFFTSKQELETMKAKCREKVKEEILMKQVRKEAGLLPKKNYKQKDKSYYFLTINPKECEINDLEIIIGKLKSKKWMKIYSYVFEQRGETNDNKGIGKHIHLIIDNNKPKCEVIREIHNAIKIYCEKEKIDLKKMDQNGKAIREKYMKGDKIESKLSSVKIDKIWRKENKLKDIFILIKEKNEIKENENDDEVKIIEEEIDKELGYQNCLYFIEEKNNKKFIKIKTENN